MKGNGWWIDQIIQDSKNRTERNNKYERGNYNQIHKLDNKIKHCVKCSRTFEYHRDYCRSRQLKMYDNLPTIGKKKEICENCKK